MEKRYNVKIKDKHSEWIEDLSLSVENPEDCAKSIINDFNRILRPGETKREFIELIGLLEEGEESWPKN